MLNYKKFRLKQRIIATTRLLMISYRLNITYYTLNFRENDHLRQKYKSVLSRPFTSPFVRHYIISCIYRPPKGDQSSRKIFANMMMEDARRQVAMGDMVHDMLVDRPPSPARMEYRSDKHAR